MCIIAFSRINQELPDRETMHTMWENNPDGAGFMYALNNKVHIRKGFMTFDELITAIDELPIDTKAVPFAIHFRIGTHGGNTPQNTHPFPVTRKVKHMRTLSYDCDLAFMHNGIIHSVELIKKSISDTMEYGRQILADLYDLDKEFYKRKSLQILIEESINGSRMLFVNGKGEFELLGDWIEHDGIMYSNNSFKSYKIPKATSKFWSSSYNGCGGYSWTKDDGYLSDGFGDFKNLKMPAINVDDFKEEIEEKTLYYIPDNCYYDYGDGYLYDVEADMMSDINGRLYVYCYESDAYECVYGTIYDENLKIWQPDKDKDDSDTCAVLK